MGPPGKEALHIDTNPAGNGHTPQPGVGVRGRAASYLALKVTNSKRGYFLEAVQTMAYDMGVQFLLPQCFLGLLQVAIESVRSARSHVLYQSYRRGTRGSGRGRPGLSWRWRCCC